MKSCRIIVLLTMVLIAGKMHAQERGEVNYADSTGMPGDNFSLQGALEMFKSSKSLEEFEKKLNDKENAINNLDLNGDNSIDYVRVIDNNKENAHAIVLQVPISKTESQDIAVIEIEKDGDQSAFIQIIGNEEVYGEETIIEPVDDVEPSDKGNSNRGPSAYSPGRPGIYVNVWFWPCVPFLFAPTYVVWVSPWYWGYYPPYWSPWPPYPWRYHYINTYHHHHHYHHYNYHRSTYAHQIYAPRRTSSPYVNNRYTGARENYKANVASRPNPQPTGRPSKPSNQPTYRPSTQPTGRPQVKPSTPTQTTPATRPQTKPSSRPQPKPATPTQTKPTTRPQTKPSTPSQVKPSPQPQQPSRNPQPQKPTGKRPQ